jgi:O-antigen/teichoic acid export membrane protein
MPTSHPQSHRAYLVNIAWSWLNVAAILAVGFIFIPVMIRRLGTAQYGVWALAVSLVEYLWMIDLGFRPATVKFAAEFRALHNYEDLKRLVNTSVAYSTCAALLIFSLAFLSANAVGRFFHIDNPAFPFLVRVVGFSWAAGMVFNMFAATLEGFQRFDLTNRANIVASVLRNATSVYLLAQGYGLREMGLALLGAQMISYLMLYVNCRRVVPELKLSPRFVSWGMARKILHYARQVMPGLAAARLSQGANPSIIAYFLPVQFVTYFTQSQRIMEYAVDAISRVGLVSAPRASDYHARGQNEEIVSLARTANRYCLTLWGVGASYLLVFGGSLCRVWINADFGNQAGVLLPILVAGYTPWMGQFISAAVLMGIARYGSYGLTLFVEAIVGILLMVFLVPNFGLAAGVTGLAVGVAVARCIVLSRIFCSEFGISQIGYLAAIFTRPLSLIVVSIISLLLYKRYVFAGETWSQLILVAAWFVPLYVGTAVLFVIQPEHRRWAVDRIRAEWARFSPVSDA